MQNEKGILFKGKDLTLLCTDVRKCCAACKLLWCTPHVLQHIYQTVLWHEMNYVSYADLPLTAR